MLLIKRFTVLVLMSALLLVDGCALQTGGQRPIVVQESSEERKARKLFEQGSYEESAALFQHLANSPSARQNNLRLLAAQASLKVAQDTKAKEYLDLLASEKLNNTQLNRLYLMYGQLDLNSGGGELALEHLHQVAIPALSRSQKLRYYSMTAFAYALTGQLISSVQTRISRDDYLNTTEQRNANNVAIIELLGLMSEATLLAQQRQSKSLIYSGWLALELTIRKVSGEQTREQAIKAWIEKYPRHPAQALIASGFFQASGFTLGDVQQIAVFLPESGPYSAHARALKAGFVAAYNQQNQTDLRPQIRFYDTEQVAIALLYSQAVAEGAQLIIGPLNKKYITELAAKVDLDVPVMALNYVEGLSKVHLYQFALSPLDEVQQIVRQARNLSYKNAIIIAAESVQGERISRYFQDAWESMQGNVLEVRTFRPAAKDFSVPVQKILNIDESQYRFQLLKKVLGTLEYQSRRRQDVDVIFLVGDRQQAQLLNPHFYHNRAESVVTYGLAKIYSSQPGMNGDMDLEGMRFCAIPWLFDEVYQGSLSMSALDDLVHQFPEKYYSLIAFGIDAYSVVAHLNELASVPYHGATGHLLLTGYNRIERHLVCAEYKNRKITLIEMGEEEYENDSSQPVVNFGSF